MNKTTWEKIDIQFIKRNFELELWTSLHYLNHKSTCNEHTQKSNLQMFKMMSYSCDFLIFSQKSISRFKKRKITNRTQIRGNEKI